MDYRTRYKEIQESNLPFELIFVSSDRDEASFDKNFAKHPWAAVPFSRVSGLKLRDHFGVPTIPSLVLIDKDRTVTPTPETHAVLPVLRA